MTDKRKEEIINNLKIIYTSFDEDEEEGLVSPTTFWLMSHYNKKYDNKERINGTWVRRNIFEYKDLLP